MDTKHEEAQKKTSTLGEIIRYALIALVVVFPIRLWVAQPFIVNGASMDNTFKDGQYLIVDEISYRFKDIERGDVVIFKYPQDPSKYFIKRIIGLPGERVVVTDDQVKVENAEHPEGVVLNEPYTGSETFGNTSLLLGADEYFVMGDNRRVSLDSRAWGALPKGDIVGRPVLRLLPFSRIGTFPGAVASTTVTNVSETP